jgi:hypothetical protein
MRVSMIMATMTQVESPDGYRAGGCNIGPAEIRARRMAGHLGVIVTTVAFAALVAVGAPPGMRLALFIPATIAAAGYLQAAMRFCAAFGWAGTFNVSDRVHETESVQAAEARAADRRKAVQIGALSALAGLMVAVPATILPI